MRSLLFSEERISHLRRGGSLRNHAQDRSMFSRIDRIVSMYCVQTSSIDVGGQNLNRN
jgi:hypothetical protein